MSENVHKTLNEAGERQELAERGSRLVSLAAAIIAVLAALGTLFAHHRSISALTVKNHAILLQARASDAYNRYEAKRVRSEVIGALLDAGDYRSDAARIRLQSYAAGEKTTSESDLAKARGLEEESNGAEDRSERVLKSYETLEIATTFFEIAIVLVSISALVRTRVFLTSGCVLSAVGVVLLLIGYFQGQ